MTIWVCLRKCCSPFPQRAVVATMVLTGLAMQYVHRLAFNLAITEITYKMNITEDHSGESCEYEEVSGKAIENLRAEFHWDSQDQANLVGAFYIGYIITHLPGGVMADEYGPKRILGYGVIVSAICSLLTPWSARVHIYLLLFVRVVMGLAQGPIFPALSVFTARWSLPNERNIMSAYMSSGLVIGAVFANAATGFLLFNLSSWDTVFYIYTIMSLVWFVLWTLFAHNSASEHPFISEKEQQKLNEALRDEITEGTKPKVPYIAIVKSVPVWAMIIGNCGHDWAFYIIASLLPQYMAYILHFNIRDNGLINCLPYIAMITISLLTAKLAEIIVTKGWLSKTFQCKLWLVFANLVPCVCYILASYAGCNTVPVVILFTAAMGIMGMGYSSVRVVNVDMAPNFAGTLMSLMNGIGALCGIFMPKVFAVFTTVQTVMAWRMAFFLSMGITTLFTIIFLIGGSSKVQPWNFPQRLSTTNNEEVAGNNQGGYEDKTVKQT